MNVGEIGQIAVVGAGLMGHGIAQEFALAGYEVHLHDLSDDLLESALARIQSNLQMLTEMGLVSPAQAEVVPIHIQTSTVLAEVVGEADLVIEAVAEDLAVKQTLFSQLDRLSPSRAILASNTSTIVPSLLASVTQRPDRVLVAHYFNPPYLLPLVEIVPTEQTSEETVAAIFDLMVKVGKRPVLVRKEVAGFIANRLQSALYREALSLVERGIATPEDVDTVITSSIGRRWAVTGVFEVSDLAGQEILQAVISQDSPQVDYARAIALVEEKVAQGKLGAKTGEGFYRWTPEKATAVRRKQAQALIEMARWP